MKQLTPEEFKNAPHEIQYLHMVVYPVGYSFLASVMEKYPEYFPEEVENRRRWESVPKEVHAAYWEEFRAIYDDLYNGIPPSKGVLYWCEHQDEFREWSDSRREANEEMSRRMELLHEKHYEKYGL